MLEVEGGKGMVSGEWLGRWAVAAALLLTWYVRQKVVANEEAHEDEVVYDLLEVEAARDTRPVQSH